MNLERIERSVIVAKLAELRAKLTTNLKIYNENEQSIKDLRTEIEILSERLERRDLT